MHATSLENMNRCFQRYIAGAFLDEREVVEVLDVGGANVNGSYRDVFSGPKIEYRAADLEAGDGVDIVLDDPYTIPIADESVDVVLSGQMLEHSEFFWMAFGEMIRILKPDGFLFLVAPSAGPIHRYPVDCYRFYPDAYGALAKYAGCHLVECWMDERGPWRDLVGVFTRRPFYPVEDESILRRAARPRKRDVAVSVGGPVDAEVGAGEEHYLDVLSLIHERLSPDFYIEIGVGSGRSLALTRCRSIGVDPEPRLGKPTDGGVRIFEETSDEFFEFDAADALSQPVELAFIDGMHLFEFALRDFMNVERAASPTGVIVIDDIYPNHPTQATRVRTTRFWTGDVWRLHRCLREARRDLFLIPLDVAPCGLLIVASLDPENRLLWNQYNVLVRTYTETSEIPPDDVLGREGAVSPRSEVLTTTLEILREAAREGRGRVDVRRELCLAGLADPV